jgi:hypothetical protein
MARCGGGPDDTVDTPSLEVVVETAESREGSLGCEEASPIFCHASRDDDVLLGCDE